MAEPAVDAVAQAIEASEQYVAMAQVVGWLATAFRAEQEQRRKQHDPASRLWVPPAPGAPRSA